jgi:hypothetical protein
MSDSGMDRRVILWQGLALGLGTAAFFTLVFEALLLGIQASDQRGSLGLAFIALGILLHATAKQSARHPAAWL